jgi:hypothetical protein
MESFRVIGIYSVRQQQQRKHTQRVDVNNCVLPTCMTVALARQFCCRIDRGSHRKIDNDLSMCFRCVVYDAKFRFRAWPEVHRAPIHSCKIRFSGGGERDRERDEDAREVVDELFHHFFSTYSSYYFFFFFFFVKRTIRAMDQTQTFSNNPNLLLLAESFFSFFDADDRTSHCQSISPTLTQQTQHRLQAVTKIR